jgi:hypothetical protein
MRPLPRKVLEELAAWQRMAGADCAVCSWELHRNGSAEHVLAAVRVLHWLDAGANTSGIFCTQASSVAPLGRRCPAHKLEICLHGTPRQWQDPQRPWVSEEKDAMLAACAAAGVSCRQRLYFSRQAPSTEQHFAAIAAFKPCS